MKIKKILSILVVVVLLFVLGKEVMAGSNKYQKNYSEFNPGTGYTPRINRLWVGEQTDGKYIFAFNASTTYNGTPVNFLARINATGSIDTSFNIGTGFDNYPGRNADVFKNNILPNGDIYLGGGFTTFNGTTSGRIIRLNSDGSVDNDFYVGSGFNGAVNSIYVLPDDRVLVGGAFTTYRGINTPRVAMLTATGTLDTTFQVQGTSFNGQVVSADVASDGKYIVAGQFSSYNGATVWGLARLNATGSLDTTFNNGGSGYQGSTTPSANRPYKMMIETWGGSEKIYVVPEHFPIKYNGTLIGGMARINMDGTLDTTFNINGGNFITAATEHLTYNSIENKYYLSSGSSLYPGGPASSITKLNYDGTIASDTFILNYFTQSPYYWVFNQNSKTLLTFANITNLGASFSSGTTSDGVIPSYYQDTEPAKLISFNSTTTNGTYSSTTLISIEARFDEVMSATSSMNVVLNTGASVYLTRAAGSSTQLYGIYRAIEGENTTDLTITSIGTSSITDINGVFSSSTYTYTIPSFPYNLGDSKNIKIDTDGPAAWSTGVNPLPPYSFTNPRLIFNNTDLTPPITYNVSINGNATTTNIPSLYVISGISTTTANNVLFEACDAIGNCSDHYMYFYPSVNIQTPTRVSSTTINDINITIVEPAGSAFSLASHTATIDGNPLTLSCLPAYGSGVRQVDCSIVGGLSPALGEGEHEIVVTGYDDASLSGTSTQSVKFDTIVPVITSINSTISPGHYKEGVSIVLDLTMSEEVATSSSLQATLSTGDTVTFSCGSAPCTTASTTYIVGAGDNTSALSIVSLDIVNLRDEAGNNASSTLGASSNIDDFSTIVIDTIAPNALTLDMATSSDLGTSSVDNITSASPIGFDGVCDTGDIINLRNNTTVLATSTCSASAFTIYHTLADGTYSNNINIIATDLAGNVSPISNSFVITVDTVDPTTPSSVDLVSGSDTGTSTTDNITSDNTPTFSATCSTTGHTMKVYDGAILVGQAVCIAPGTISITTNALIDGSHNISFTETDLAGNESVQSAPVVVIITDTVAPTITAIDLSNASDSGASSTDNITNDNTPTFSNSCTTGSTINLYVGGIFSTTTMCIAGNFSITPTFTDGIYNIEFKEIDIAGNTSATSTALSLTIDTQGPSLLSFTSTSTSGRYDIGENIYINAIWNEILHSTSSMGIMHNATSTISTTTLGYISTSTLSGLYTVSVGDYANPLNISSILLHDIMDLAGNYYSTTSLPTNISSSTSIIADGIPPRIVSTEISGNTVVVTFSEDMATTSFATTSFEIVIGGATTTITNALLIGNTLTFTLLSSAVAGQSISIAYINPGGADISDLSGNSIVTTYGNTVTNNTPVVAVFTGGGGGGGGYSSGGGFSSTAISNSQTTQTTQTTQNTNSKNKNKKSKNKNNSSTNTDAKTILENLDEDDEYALLKDINKNKNYIPNICEPHIVKPIEFGKENDKEEVKKLEKFFGLKQDGVYDEKDVIKVKEYQNKNSAKILRPWNLKKASGYVFTSTLKEINKAICEKEKKIACPYFDKNFYVEGDEAEEIIKIKSFLNKIEGEKLKIDTKFDKNLTEALKRFQTKNSEKILKPWNAKTASGRWYQATKYVAHEKIGCFETVKLDNGKILQ